MRHNYGGQFNKPKFKFNPSIKSSSKQYSNPFFNKKRRGVIFGRIIISLRTKIIVLLVATILVAVIWFLFYSNYFTIKNIVINNQGGMPADSIRTMVDEQMAGSKLIFWPQKNIFIFNAANLRTKLQNNHSFNDLAITKKLPSTLVVALTERQYTAIWQEDNNYYYLDNSGDIVAGTNATDIVGKGYPLIKNISNNKIANNKAPVDISTLQFILNLFTRLKDYTNEFKVANYTIDNDLFTVKVQVENGPQIYFNTQADMDNQIKRVILLKKEQLKNDFLKKQYINVKIEDRVYYR